jgi:hypothetical protein
MMDNRCVIASMPLYGKFIEPNEENHMKRLLGCALLVALLSAPAFAEKNSGSVTIAEPVTVGNTQLPAADYKVMWTGLGPNGQVTLIHGKTRITVPAKVTEQKNNAPSILTDSKNGSNALQAIYLNKVSLVLTGSPIPGQ